MGSARQGRRAGQDEGCVKTVCSSKTTGNWLVLDNAHDNARGWATLREIRLLRVPVIVLTAVSTNRAAHTLEPSFGLREDEALCAKEDYRSSTRTLVQASLRCRCGRIRSLKTSRQQVWELRRRD